MERYLHAGVSALANSKNKFNHPWFLGHTGAAVIAGYFLLKENDFSEEVKISIESYLNNLIANDDDLFEVVSTDEPQNVTEDFLNTLSDCVKTHSTTGHGVIFGVLLLKAISVEPALFTKEVETGVRALLKDCLQDVANRHYKITDYHAPDVDFTGIKRFESVKVAAKYSLTVHETIYPDQLIDNVYYFLAGDLLHCVTYAHALCELADIGHYEMANSGLNALSEHIFLSSKSHSELEPISTMNTYDPNDLSFWERPITEPHHIKLAYAALSLTKNDPEEHRKSVFTHLSKYWEFYT